MEYLGTISAALFTTVFIVFSIITLGYLLGKISIRGINLGTAGVLLVALFFGILASYIPYFNIGGKEIVLFLDTSCTLEDGTVLSETKSFFSLISNIGTAFFVTSVGLIAGPKFFRTFNRKSLSYILMATIIIALGCIIAIGIILISKDPNVDSSLVVGLMTGALTSTPGLAAAKEVAANEAKCVAGYGIGYLFGVLGVVLFVQILPKILHVDMKDERAVFQSSVRIEIKASEKTLKKIEPSGIFVFAITVMFGCIIGCIKIPGINFSLGASGGTLIAGLLVGHFGHIGKWDCNIKKDTLRLLQEIGLCLFLVGAGVPGGVNFVSNVKLSYFIFGALITLIPMIVGYLLGRFVFHLSLLNNLGSITGGMTSTPALGALISASGMDDVIGPYAATYPFALFCIVLASRIIVSII